MKFLDRLEKRFGNWAVPNVVMFLVIAQVFILGMILLGRVDFASLLLMPKKVFEGEWWRLLSFMVAPPNIPNSVLSMVFIAFFWYIFWMMSTSLETLWSVFRFNVYLFSGLLFSVAGAFLGQLISPGTVIYLSPYFLYLSVFFAFATTHPDIQFLIFFVIPMKVKWMAYFVGGLTALTFIFAPTMGDRVAILFPLLNYFLFFRGAFGSTIESRKRRAKFESEKRVRDDEALHQCVQCGATDKSDSGRDFRYRVVEGEAECICEACRTTEPST
jgi:hypothetical protein